MKSFFIIKAVVDSSLIATSVLLIAISNFVAPCPMPIGIPAAINAASTSYDSERFQVAPIAGPSATKLALPNADAPTKATGMIAKPLTSVTTTLLRLRPYPRHTLASSPIGRAFPRSGPFFWRRGPRPFTAGCWVTKRFVRPVYGSSRREFLRWKGAIVLRLW